MLCNGRKSVRDTAKEGESCLRGRRVAEDQTFKMTEGVTVENIGLLLKLRSRHCAGSGGHGLYLHGHWPRLAASFDLVPR
jgi:hypothetical protein